MDSIVLIVAAGTPERELGAAQLDAQVKAVGKGYDICDKYVDNELVGATKAWTLALERLLDQYPGNSIICVLSDDSEVSAHFSPTEFYERMVASGCDFGDMQANHPAAAKALEAGYGYYTTADGFTAFGATATSATWANFLEWKTQNFGDGAHLKFDELVNIYCQLNGFKILKPTMSLVEHRLEFKSLEGNDRQNKERIVRRSAHFDRNAAPVSGELVHLGRTYQSNHWRFLWTMDPEERKQTSYVRAAYEVDRDTPPKVISPVSSTEKATSSEGEAAE